MRLWKQQRWTVLALGVALAALLVLTTLQYQWVTQVSAAARERMQTNMQVGAERLRDDVNRELARAYLSFQIRADTVNDRDWARYARRYDNWFNTAPYPRLVKQVYLVEINQRGRVRLSHFDPATKQFKPNMWPPTLASLRRSYEQAYPSDLVAGITTEYVPDPIVADVPALVIPMARQWTLTDSQAFGLNADVLFAENVSRNALNSCMRCASLASDDILFAHTIVLLDEPYLLREFVPTLAQRHLGAGDTLNYDLSIVSRAQPDNVIYASNPQHAANNVARSDVSINLFSVNFDELNRLALTDRALEGADADAGSDTRVSIGILGSRSPENAPRSQAAANAGDGYWQLRLQHQAGSLEAAVNNLLVRNLLISFGAALVLAVAFVLLVISTQRAQRLAAQKLAFAASISHELRTPLAVLSSAGANLADGIVNDPQHARRYGTLIRAESGRLHELVEQALLFAGVQSGRQKYTQRPVVVDELIADVIESCRSQFRERHVVVEREIAPDLPPVRGDAVLLRRALTNLLANAIKYSEANCWVCVQADAVRGKHGAEVRIMLRDRGMGIASGDVPHIFEPFFRAQSVVDAQIHGSGLGLSLVRHIVQAHRGRISVDSAPGQGSTFTVCLPALDPSDRAEHQLQEGSYESTYFAH